MISECYYYNSSFVFGAPSTLYLLLNYLIHVFIYNCILKQ